MNSTATQLQAEPSMLDVFAELLHQGHLSAQRPDAPVGLVKMWFGRVRVQLRKTYGAESEVVANWPLPDSLLTKEGASAALQKRLAELELVVAALRHSGMSSAGTPLLRASVFIGHGRSAVWRELKDFLADELALPWDEFNRESVAGIATTERLVEMLNSASFAFLVMTGEDEHADATVHARANVIHEVGLFQGRLGLRKAIVLLEHGCAEFSNIHGLTHIPFSRGNISSAFEEIRRVLRRERVISI